MAMMWNSCSARLRDRIKIAQCHRTFKTAYMEAGQIILEQKGLETKFSMEDFMAEYEEYAEDFLL
jgi:hypothetical protein